MWPQISRKKSKKRPTRSKRKETSPEIPIADSAQRVRALTPLEFGYARGHFRLLSWGHIIAVVIGLAMVPICFVIAGLIGGEYNTRAPFLMLFAPLLVLASLGLGAFIIWFAPKRKHALQDGAFVFDGIMEENVSRLFNPKTGQSATIRKYRIGDANIIWPSGAESIYRPFVNKRIQVMAAVITRSNPLTLFGEQPRDAVVLEFGDSIRIHHALQKYGRNLFLVYHIKTFLFSLVFAGLVAIAVIYFFPETYDHNGFTAFLAIVGLTISSILVFVVSFVVFEWITEHLGIRMIPIEEKLRG